MSKQIKTSIVFRFSPVKSDKIDNLKRLLVEAYLARIAKNKSEKSAEL